MKSPRMYCVLLVAALGTPTDIYSQAAAGLATDSSTQRELDQALNAAVAHGDVPGVVAIAANRNGVIYQGAFGLAETTAGRAMTSDAIFRTASMGKAVTSVALMQLVEEGRVALDDPASKYLPELADLVVLTSFDPVTGRYTVKPAEKSVTVRNLLTHTSGLGYAFTSAVVRDFKPRDGDHFAAGPLLFEPGAQWLYGTSM